MKDSGGGRVRSCGSSDGDGGKVGVLPCWVWCVTRL